MDKIKCVPVPAVKELLRAFQNGEITSAEIYKMSEAERTAYFSQFGSKELASFLQKKIDDAMLKNSKEILKAVAFKKLFKTGREAEYEAFVNKTDKYTTINEIESEKKELIGDILSQSYDVSLKKEEMKAIVDKANKLEQTYESQKDLPYPNIKYWKERRELENYMAGLTPEHKLKVFTQTAGRGAMLLSVKSPLLNIESNTLTGITEAVTKRIAHKSVAYATIDEGIQFIQDAVSIFSQTGYDITRMISINDNRYVLGEKVTTSQGKGLVRAYARFYEDIVFKALLGTPDVAYASVAFADTAGLMATKIAKGNKAKAKEIFNDAIRLEPKTADGQIIRAQAISDAQVATYTNDSWASKVSLGLKKYLNENSGDLSLGDMVMPFVKTPANVIALTVDYSGLGLVRVGVKMKEALENLNRGNPEQMRSLATSTTRAGLGFIFTLMLVSAIDPEDYIGEYDDMFSGDRNLTKVKNGVYNAIKVGDKYISLDFLGPLAASFVGMMYAKKYGDTFPQKVGQYFRGVATQSLKVPGFRESADLIKGIQRAVKEKDFSKSGGLLGETFIDFAGSRIIPAIVSDIAKMTDEFQRDASGGALERIANKIPFIRENLEPLINQTTGEPKTNESALSVLLFGGRVKTANTDPVTLELVNLYDNGAKPSISDVRYSSKVIKELKEEVSKEQFTQALETFGKSFNKRALKVIKSGRYKNSDYDEKAKMLNKERSKTMEEIKKSLKRTAKKNKQGGN